MKNPDSIQSIVINNLLHIRKEVFKEFDQELTSSLRSMDRLKELFSQLRELDKKIEELEKEDSHE